MTTDRKIAEQRAQRPPKASSVTWVEPRLAQVVELDQLVLADLDDHQTLVAFGQHILGLQSAQRLPYGRVAHLQRLGDYADDRVREIMRRWRFADANMYTFCISQAGNARVVKVRQTGAAN